MTSLKNLRHIPIELIFLALMILFMPSLEGPKNIFWGFFIISWFITHWKQGDLFTHWNHWDNLLLLYMFSAFIAAPFAGIEHKEWTGGKNIVVYMSILLLLKHSSYNKDAVIFLFKTVLVSTLIATSYGLWNFLITHELQKVELHSVGHVNHSAIYLLISLGVGLAILLACWKDSAWPSRLTWLFIVAIMITAIVMSSSRSAVFMMGLLMLFFGHTWRKHSRVPLIIFCLLLAIGAVGLFVGKAAVVEKQIVQMESGQVLKNRDMIWRSALLAWRQFPIFGIGAKNYSDITEKKMRHWLEREGKDYDENQYLPYPHAHHLLLNTLVEQGLFGFVLLTALLTYLSFQLYRAWPSEKDSYDDWAIWMAASGALFTTLFLGMFNTTLHHEHGMLTMLLIGLWMMHNGQKKRG